MIICRRNAHAHASSSDKEHVDEYLLFKHLFCDLMFTCYLQHLRRMYLLESLRTDTLDMCDKKKNNH